MMIGGKKRDRSELIHDLWSVMTLNIHDLSNADIIDLTFIVKEKAGSEQN